MGAVQCKKTVVEWDIVPAGQLIPTAGEVETAEILEAVPQQAALDRPRREIVIVVDASNLATAVGVAAVPVSAGIIGIAYFDVICATVQAIVAAVLVVLKWASLGVVFVAAVLSLGNMLRHMARQRHDYSHDDYRCPPTNHQGDINVTITNNVNINR